MSSPDYRRDELQRLASALCDAAISREQAQRLESLATQSPEALEHLLEYLDLHAELAWTLGLVAERAVTGPKEPVLGVPRRKTAGRWTGIAVAAAVVLLVGVLSTLAILSGPAPRRSRLSDPIVVARLIRSVNAKWSDGAAPQGEGADLMAEQLLGLKSGVAQIRFQSGAGVILDGREREVRFELSSAKRGLLQFGRLTAWVPPRASGFTIGTPSATIIDRGTEIGVVVQGQGTSTVHVLDGKVQVRPRGPSGRSPPRDVSAGSAVRVASASGRAQQVEEIPPLKEASFLWELGPVERLRKLAESDPRLIHHYPFEGLDRKSKFADWCGSRDLAEVLMHGGGGGLDIYELAPGLDDSTTALRPFRSPQDGDRVGVALESQAEFEVPRNLTVELLLVLETPSAPADEMVASAVVFPADPRGAGALGVVADRGRLVFCLGRSAREGADPTVLEPNRWYYVAATFEAGEGQTTVNGYLADLTEADAQLVQVARDLVFEGTPTPGPLRIGGGFDRQGASAYPWSGRLDEIAIYGAVLDRQTLEQHLTALLNKP